MNSLPEHWIWRDVELAAGPAAVVDLDGVLADATGRQHHLQLGKPDWHSFFDAAGSDPVIEPSKALVDALDPKLAVILLTGRPLRIRKDTKDWLAKHEIRWDMLIMRNQGNYGKSQEFKRVTLRELRNKGWDLRIAFEDDEVNCKMFNDEGVPCVYIHSGYYESRAIRFPTDPAAAGESTDD